MADKIEAKATDAADVPFAAPAAKVDRKPAPKANDVEPAFEKTVDTANDVERINTAYAAIEPHCHKMTLIVPRMKPEEMDALVESIRTKGFNPHDPIIVDGPVESWTEILDGRSRSTAAKYIWPEGDDWMSHVTFRQADEDEKADILSTVITRNLARRNLDREARALIAARMWTGELPCEIPPTKGRVRDKIATMCSVTPRSVEDAKAGLSDLRYLEVNMPKDPEQQKELTAIRVDVDKGLIAPYALKTRTKALREGKVHQPARRVQSNTDSTVEGAVANPYTAIAEALTPPVVSERLDKVTAVLVKTLDDVPAKERKAFLKLLTASAIDATLKRMVLKDTKANADAAEAAATKAKAEAAKAEEATKTTKPKRARTAKAA